MFGKIPVVLLGALLWLNLVVPPGSLGGPPDEQVAFPFAVSKKGLQVEIVEDAIALGVKHATFNVSLTSLLADREDDEQIVWEHLGRSYYFNRRYVTSLEHGIKALSDEGVLVYLIVLAIQSRDARKDELVLHPNFDRRAPNGIGAFNAVTDEGRNAFAAAMAFMAARWSRKAGPDGRVVGYIIGNEVNSHWYWYNQGEVSAAELVQDYGQTVKLAAEAVRSQSGWARVYVSLDHYWDLRHSPDKPLRSMGSHEFLERFSAWVRTHGDFEWHIAFHPYPENLFDPKFWEDETALLDIDTPRVTFKNLEVLVRYLRQPRMLYRGQPRSVILSEQGFHTPDGPQGELWQAAAYCLAYKQIEALDGIDAFILHRHVDHPHEGGLRLGLLRRGSDGRPADKKLIYDCFRDADRPEWKGTFEFALPVLGLSNWEEAVRSK